MTADELRNELGSLIWKTATNLVHGGKVSPVQFMDFMLGSLFYRFISEDVIDYCNNLMRDAGVPDPDYVNMPDEVAENARDQIINAKGGEFYTPAEVSYLLAKIAASSRTSVNKVYDPACGSGSLLLKFKEILGTRNVIDGFFGQEINLKTYNLCRMNMFLHNVNYDHFDIQQGDTLKNPRHSDEEPFDAIVSNPPYSIPWDGPNDPTLINDPRFSPAGVLAPASKADLAFTMHMLSWLSTEGTAAIIEFPGVLYQGGAEQKIRQYLVSNNYVDTVIQLPQNLFFGTSIATCIIVLKKNKPDNRVCFIDASNEFVHEGNKNKLSDENIGKIYNTQSNKTEVEHFSKVVTTAEIEAQKFNLSVSTYVEKEDTSVEVDIEELNERIAQIVARQSVLRIEIDELVKTL